MKTPTAELSPQDQKKWFLILLVLSLVTMALHAYLTYQHYSLKIGLSSGPSLCNISASFNCDSVAVSKYAQFFGIPMAILGLFTQVVLLVILVSSHFSLSAHSQVLKRQVFWGSVFVALVSVIMGSISSLILKTYCLFCMGTYLLSIASLFAAWKFQDGKILPHLLADISSLFTNTRWALVMILLIPAGGYLAHSIIMDSYNLGRLEQTIQDSVAQWEHASVQNFTADGLLYQKGDGEPTFVIVEFADYLCPHCKVAYPTLHAFTDAHPSSRLIFKPFPLDGKCNKAIPHAGDGYRCKLAALSLCSEQVGKKGWAAHQWIFDHQETLPGLGKWNDTVKEVAQELQLNEGDLTQCVDSDAIYDKIQASANEGAKAQVPGTPAIFVNNKSLPGGAFLPILQGLYTKVMSN